MTAPITNYRIRTYSRELGRHWLWIGRILQRETLEPLVQKAHGVPYYWRLLRTSCIFRGSDERCGTRRAEAPFLTDFFPISSITGATCLCLDALSSPDRHSRLLKGGLIISVVCVV